MGKINPQRMNNPKWCFAPPADAGKTCHGLIGTNLFCWRGNCVRNLTQFFRPSLGLGPLLRMVSRETLARVETASSARMGGASSDF